MNSIFCSLYVSLSSSELTAAVNGFAHSSPEHTNACVQASDIFLHLQSF